MSLSPMSSQKAIVGNPKGNFWLYDSLTGFDLTHPLSPTSPAIEGAIRVSTMTSPITFDPVKSALVIVDMQNFFLSPEIGRPPDSKGLQAQQELLQYAIPAARKAGIRIIWLNWGVTDEELEQMPPKTYQMFGLETVQSSQFLYYLETRPKQGCPGLPVTSQGVSDHNAGDSHLQIKIESMDPKIYKGFGNQIGPVELQDGSIIEAGRLLFRDQWNSDLTPELRRCYEEGLQRQPPDVWIHKNRMSGLWGTSTMCTDFLDQEGIKTLFFAGVNTDQCVGGSLTDACSKGYDCILLSDGAATSSPAWCQDASEYNVARGLGFCTSCKDLWEGISVQKG